MTKNEKEQIVSSLEKLEFRVLEMYNSAILRIEW